jgi:hypothetical protein
MVTLRAWERLEKFIKWEHKKKYGRMPKRGGAQEGSLPRYYTHV